VTASNAVDELRHGGTIDGLDRYQLYSWSIVASHMACARAFGWNHEEIDDDPEDCLREIEVCCFQSRLCTRWVCFHGRCARGRIVYMYALCPLYVLCVCDA